MNHSDSVSAMYNASTRKRWKWLTNWELYLLLLLPVIYVLVFKYYPMYGAQIAFKDYRVTKGIFGSDWVGVKHFVSFFTNYQFSRIITNTLGINIYMLIAGFPAPVILALLLNYLPSRRFKKTVQMVTYVPYFISTVVMVALVIQFTSIRSGLINNVIELFGGQRIDMMGNKDLFWSLYVWSGIWQGTGYGSIIYIAALSSVDPELHEAAVVDGATLVQRIWHIDIPSIAPTIVILLILRCGNIINVGFEKTLLMQNSLNLARSEVISTYTYKVGLASSSNQYSYASAIGLFTSAINFVMLIVVNAIAKKLNRTSLF
ncbi:MAG: ABC transporter permease subunit [Eubacteriales bacterium]|nr:ABC transporter permease subunit [Eubacteriales bacterium]